MERSLLSERGCENGNGVEMCVFPLFRQKAMFPDWIPSTIVGL